MTIKANLVDVVIVNWNSGDQVAACVRSVLRHGSENLGTVIVVDNASSDGSHLLPSHPQVEIIRMPANVGFGTACNIGARGSAADLLFLNPDARLTADSLPALLRYMASDDAQDVGICGVKLVGDDGLAQRCCARFPTAQSLLAGMIGTPSITMTEFDHLDSRDVAQVIGAFFFVRRAVFEQLGGFDQRFFLYYEEVDFAFRAYQAGWRSRYLSTASAYHRGGGTTDQIKARRTFYLLRSRSQYAFKHFTLLHACLILLCCLALDPIARMVRACMRRSPDQLGEAFVAAALLWRDLPLTLWRAGHRNTAHP